MFQNRSSTVLLGLLLCAAPAAAQLNVTLQLPFKQMPARIAEWRENESLIRIVVQNTGRERYDGLMLSVELSKDGRRIARSRDGHPAQPRWSLGPGETRSLSWREVIAEEAIEYDGSIRQQVIATGELPEGQYRLCIQVLSAQMRPIGPRPCVSFGIVLADPPRLIRPIGGAQLQTPMPLLEWTPSTPPAPGLQYRVTVKVRYRGQTPAQAMASNPVRLQVDVPTTSYQVGLAEQLGADAADPNYAGHVWQVQALLNGRPYGRNRGLSQIEWFLVPPIAVDSVKPGDGRPIAVLEWEVPYEVLSTGRPIRLEVPPVEEDTVLYVLRVRIPEQLSSEQLEQLMKNWAHDVRKEISVMRMSQDTLRIQCGTYRGGFFLYRAPQDTLRIQCGTYRGGFFLYRAPQDTLRIQYVTTYRGGFFLYGAPQDTARVFYGLYIPGGYYLYSLPQDTLRIQYGTYRGGFFLYSLPQDTTPSSVAALVPPTYTVWIRYPYSLPQDTPVPVHNVLVLGHFTPTHVALPMPELEIDPGEGPVCGLPVPEEQQPSAMNGDRDEMGPVALLWPNGNPPRNPNWPWVGVIGTPVLEGIEGEGAGPGKPQNCCGTEYIWIGPRPKSPKLTLTVGLRR